MQRSTRHGYQLFLWSLLLSSVCSALISTVVAQEPVGKAGERQKPPVSTKEEISPAPAKVDVKPVARDEEIRKRLLSVLDATDWFTVPQVRVEEGVVFLSGRVESAELKNWAGDLASNTRDVVAVANRMEVPEPPVWISVRRGADCWCYGAILSAPFHFSPLGFSSSPCRWGPAC